MKKIIIASALAAMAAPAFAQSAIDAYTLNPTELRGTARFMSMGGAFTSLGGDLSAVSQNPAGIGVYRRSEIGATLDIDIRNNSTQTASTKINDSQTKVYCNNFGYVGTIDLSGELKTFSWGVNYNRLASFDNYYRGYNARTSNSLSNYVASFSNGYSSSELDFGDNYNPYSDSSADWLSILSYNTYMINPNGSNSYRGLYQTNTEADAAYNVRETGYVDSYDITFGGNVSNTVFWGVGVGIYDMNYTRQVQYSESLDNAATYNGTTASNNAGFDLLNVKSVSGTGANVKFGVILKPVNEFRFGLSVQTPTWMQYNHDAYAENYYSYNDGSLSGSENTDYAEYKSRMNSPWRLSVGASGVLGNTAIVSLDYERVAYNDMKVKYQDSYGYWGGNSYVEDTAVTDDIHDYFKAANIIRVGAEVRVTPQFSARAGYNVQLSNVRSDVYDGYQEVFTSGTDPSYRFDKTTQNVCLGLGYRYQQFYIDAAYVYRNRESKFSAYTNYNGGGDAPTAKITENNHSLVFSAGFKF
jgi:hypothetical protein